MVRLIAMLQLMQQTVPLTARLMMQLMAQLTMW